MPMPTRSLAPLPVEPATPYIESQTATAQGSADLAELAQWRYRLDYRHEHRAQDVVVVAVAFNAPPDAESVAAAAAPACTDYRYRARLIFSDDGERIEALELTSEQPEPGPGGRWPQAHCRTYADADIALGNGEGEGDRRRYAFDPPQADEGWPRIGLSWSGLVLAGIQNAQPSLAAVRNGHLDEPVADDQIFRTPTATAAAVSPRIRWSQDVTIDALGDHVDTALDALFACWFGERRNGQCVSLQMSFGFRAGTGDADLLPMTYVPVGLLSIHPLGRETAQHVAEALASWKEMNAPLARDAEWLFSLTLFSQLDTRVPQPLLDVSRILRRA
jgi:hypothetical protein